MLIETYDLEVFTPPCDPEAVRYAAKAHLACDISDVLPYLNATLPGAVYLPQAQALTWKKAGHSVAFHAREIAVSNVEDRGEAQKELKGVIDLVNRTWERRSEITPSVATRQRPAPMALYKLLPQTNCHQCGERSCYYFALKLATSQKRLADCPVLAEPQYAEQAAALNDLVINAPAAVGNDVQGGVVMDSKRKVLFLCTGNSCRSQMAEAIVNGRLSDEWTAVSAGTEPAGYVHPLAVEALREIGIEHAGHSKSVQHFVGQPFDVVITVCDSAAENCPVWFGQGQRVHIGFRDPAKFVGTPEETLQEFRAVRDEIASKVTGALRSFPEVK